jgi:ribosomal protein S18 acetylase RimI-like enzyme
MSMIDVVPPRRSSEAIEMLVSEMAGEVRSQQARAIYDALVSDHANSAGLLGQFCGDRLMAVCWLQPQPGHTATLWPPVSPGELEPSIATALVARSLEVAATQGAALVQSLLLTDAGRNADTLLHSGFAHVADLLYLVSPADKFPQTRPDCALDFVAFGDAGMKRLERIVERSYEGTLDCPALNGVRALEDVLAGYRAVGKFRQELWLVARLAAADVGCVLLTDHAPQRVWELLYLGVLPEYRGRGLGLEITRYAQWLAARENVERVVLAVDAANEPAKSMYAAAGFTAWDRRSVFVKVLLRAQRSSRHS